MLHHDYWCDRRVSQARLRHSYAQLHNRLGREKVPLVRHNLASRSGVQSLSDKVLLEKQIREASQAETTLLHRQIRLCSNSALQSNWKVQAKHREL